MGSTWSQSWAGMLVPLARAFVRFAPPSSFKTGLWQRWIDPYLAWRDHHFVARTEAGNMSGTTRDILQQYLYYFGTWEPQTTGFIRRALRPGDAFIDIGANVGYFSLLAARLVGPEGKVVSVEADPQIFGLLQTNIRRNRAPVRAVNVAASDRPGTLSLYQGEAENCGATTIVPANGNLPKAVVRALPMDAVLDPEEVSRARLVKIDVEGAEAAVLSGMSRFLRQCPRTCEFMVEIHAEQLRALGRSSQEILDAFAAEGFHPYWMENDYDATAYLWPQQPKPFPRFSGQLDYDTNLVFSRKDQEAL